MKKAWNLYHALEDSQKKLLNEARASKKLSASAWLRYLQAVGDFDEEADKLRPKFGWMIPGGLLAAFGIFVIGVEIHPVIGYVANIGWMASLAALVAYLVMRSVDVNNGLHEFIIPLLKALGEDTDATTPVEMKFDLEDHLTERYFVRRENRDPGMFSYPKVKETYYNAPWFSIATVLSDGTRVKVSITDFIRKRDITKKSRSGKTKYKTKYKVKRKYLVEVSAKSSKYGFDAGADDKVVAKSGSSRQVLRSSKVEVLGDPGASPSVFELLGAVQAAFNRLRPGGQA